MHVAVKSLDASCSDAKPTPGKRNWYVSLLVTEVLLLRQLIHGRYM